MSSTQTETILNRICANAFEQKAEEIYLISGQIPFVRREGKLGSMVGEKILAVSFIQDVIGALLSPEEQNKLNEFRQLIAVKEIGKLGASQVSVYYQRGLPCISLKLLVRDVEDLDKLGVPEMIKPFTELLRGIVFIAGPRDSGRFSLMAALVNYINKREARFITTLERPIKYNLVGAKSVIEQREVPRDVPSFPEGLRFSREKNSEVVMVSHIEDRETMEEIFITSEAGSLVFGVLDTASVYKTIKRILHFFPHDEEADARYFLSENLAGIIATRMVPRVGGGRIRALEILPATPAVRTIIAEGKLHQITSVLQASQDQRSISLDQYLADLVTSGKVLVEEALKHCVDEEMLRSLLRR